MRSTVMNRRHKVHLFGLRSSHIQRGFTLVEVLVASAVLILATTGILLSYLRCLELNEVSRNSSLAVKVAKSKMEEIKSTAFNNIRTTFHQVNYSVPGLTARMVSYVDDSTADLLEVTVTVCWQQQNGRIYGEDINLNGQLDGGEDTNGNGILDSPVKLVSKIFRP